MVAEGELATLDVSLFDCIFLCNVGVFTRQDAASFENLHYREVWTYLYAMLALVLLLEGWSAQLRRRFVA